jgi:peptidyl-tRNA hydrolase
MSLRMYCIVARDSLKAMNGNRGKLAAQAGHAYLHAYWDAETRFAKNGWCYPKWADDWQAYDKMCDLVQAYRASGRATKVCLVVDTVDDLKALYEAYRPVCGVSLVTDAGLTCFDGPTTTCLGIGPIGETNIGEDLKCLKVLI